MAWVVQPQPCDGHGTSCFVTAKKVSGVCLHCGWATDTDETKVSQKFYSCGACWEKDCIKRNVHPCKGWPCRIARLDAAESRNKSIRTFQDLEFGVTVPPQPPVQPATIQEEGAVADPPTFQEQPPTSQAQPPTSQ